MHILKRFNRYAVITLFALALALGFTAVSTPKPADAEVVAVYIAKTSEHNITGYDQYYGSGLHQTMRPGQWFAMGNGVASVKVNDGCELWVHGARAAKRRDHDWYYNFWVRESKATIRLSNCR
jgi:hypothetical protein